MSEIEIEITNPDDSVLTPVLIDSPGYDEYLDRPRRLTAKIEKRSGLDIQGIANVSIRGKTLLLGHVTKFDQSSSDFDALTLDSAEYLLDQRIGQFYRFPAGTTLSAMLQKLIDMANGLIPRGSWTLHAGSVYKITGAGTASNFGTLPAIYQNFILLTKDTVIPASAGRWYQSATDLYIWCSDSRSPDYSLIIAPNFKDTLVRLGTISLGTTTFSVCFEIGAAKLFPTIKALILAAGLEWNIRYEKDGYAYLDAVAAIGKGSSTEPVATYIHGLNADVSSGQIDGLGRLQALLGQGAGTGITQQCAASLDLATLGTWREAVYQAGGLFGSMLRTATGKVFLDYQDPTIYNIRVPEQDWSQAAGNYVSIVRQGYQPVVRRIKHIQMTSAGDMKLEVGQRLRTLQELLKSGEEVQQILSSFYGSHTKNAWSWSFPEKNIDSATAIEHVFELKNSDENGEIDINFPYIVTLNLKIGWYTANTYQASVASASHGSVGSHSGYGGKATSSEEMTEHAIAQQQTTGSTTGTNTIYAFSGWGPYNLYNYAHYHRLYFVADGVAYGDAEYEDLYVECPINDYTDDNTEALSLQPASAFSSVTGGHTHPLPAHYTNDAGNQSHDTSSEAAKARAGSSSHPEVNAILQGLLKQYATGNSLHYLTLTVKLNGTNVPGSPWSGALGAGAYIGDSFDNIYMSELAVVGAKNILTLEVSEWGGSGPVRCSLSGSVNVNAVISAF